MPGLDNTPRRQNISHCYYGSSPDNYEFWLGEIIHRTLEHNAGDERLVFINAWNEWGEGCHLEPDRKYGHRFLEATNNAITGTSSWQVLLKKMQDKYRKKSTFDSATVEEFSKLFES